MKPLFLTSPTLTRRLEMRKNNYGILILKLTNQDQATLAIRTIYSDSLNIREEHIS